MCGKSCVSFQAEQKKKKCLKNCSGLFVFLVIFQILSCLGAFLNLTHKLHFHKLWVLQLLMYMCEDIYYPKHLDKKSKWAHTAPSQYCCIYSDVQRCIRAFEFLSFSVFSCHVTHYCGKNVCIDTSGGGMACILRYTASSISSNIYEHCNTACNLLKGTRREGSFLHNVKMI